MMYFFDELVKSVEFISPLLILIAPCFLSFVSAQDVGQGQLQSTYVTDCIATGTRSLADMRPPRCFCHNKNVNL